MVDNLTPSDPAVEGAPAKGGLVGFLSTTRGKLIVGGVALLLVIAAAAGVFVMFIQQPGGDALEPLVPPAGSVSTTATPDGSVEATPTYRRAKPLSSTFVFRNIFIPTVKASTTASSSSGASSTAGGSTTASGTPNVPANTLYLQSVTTVDGEPVATFIWNGQTYTASEGDRLGDTPWMVVDISGDSVTMLYGDTRITLTVGQGLSK